MKIFKILFEESPRVLLLALAFSILAGLANGGIMSIINAAAEHATIHDYLSLLYLLLFILIFIALMTAKYFAQAKSAVLLENVIRKIRLNLAERISKVDLQFIERSGPSSLLATATRETQNISQSTVFLFEALSSSVMIIFCFFYIYHISSFAFLMSLSFIGVGAIFFIVEREEHYQNLNELTLKEEEFFGSINHLLTGFKELKINQKKSVSWFQQSLLVFSDVTKKIRIKVALNHLDNSLIFSGFFFLLLAAMVFIVPSYVQNSNDRPQSILIMKFVAAILLMYGPFQSIIFAWPHILKAEASLVEIEKLEGRLEEVNKEKSIDGEMGNKEEIKDLDFETINFQDILFSYDSPAFQSNPAEFKNKQMNSIGRKKSFSVGPLNFGFKKGEIVFIVGGNGSGKSTLLKLLTGLYYPEKGRIKLDNHFLSQDQYPVFHQRFSAIFSDFYLFDRLYQNKKDDDKNVNEWIQKMELWGKTDFKNGKFTNLQLSTGQKKRLAYIVSVLEDRPIYIFDEWAADQDPHFKKFFYENLLTELKEQGKTVIAVTHDDNYFERADRIFKMEYGQLKQIF